MYFYRFYFEVFLHFHHFFTIFIPSHLVSTNSTYKQVTSSTSHELPGNSELNSHWSRTRKSSRLGSYKLQLFYCCAQADGLCHRAIGLNVAHSKEIGASQPNTAVLCKKNRLGVCVAHDRVLGVFRDGIRSASQF